MKKLILIFAIVLISINSYSGTIIQSPGYFYLEVDDYDGYNDYISDNEFGSFYTDNTVSVGAWASSYHSSDGGLYYGNFRS